MRSVICAAAIFAFAAGFVAPANAQDFTSTHFMIEDLTPTSGGGDSSSDGFEVIGGVGQVGTEESTSESFTQRSGSFYFPVATTPVVSATAGESKVTLSWTAAVGTLATINEYEVGIASTSGGSYTFESVGNALSFVKTGLTAGTTYYFVIRANADGASLAVSAEVSAVPTSSSVTPSTTPSSGGGGGGYVPPTAVNFSGWAYPLSKVRLLKDGQLLVSTIAGPDAKFSISLSGLSPGDHVFSIYSEDKRGNKSTSFTLPSYVTTGATTNVSGVFIVPTIDVNKTEVKRGDTITIFGQSVPESDITIVVNSDEELFVKTTSDETGAYVYNLDTSFLETGQHFTKAKAVHANLVSPFSKTVGFKVGTRTVLVAETIRALQKGDANKDSRVNINDFSVAAYWYGRTNPPSGADLDGDGKVNLKDFSIMAYYWTG